MGEVTTIRDVARLAEVSVATVSRALNGQQNVARPVRERVLDAARELKYVPHHAARSLSSRKTRSIGVGTVSIDNHGGARAMVEHLASQGFERIAFVAGPSDNFDADERLRGYR